MFPLQHFGIAVFRRDACVSALHRSGPRSPAPATFARNERDIIAGDNASANEPWTLVLEFGERPEPEKEIRASALARGDAICGKASSSSESSEDVENLQHDDLYIDRLKFESSQSGRCHRACGV
jgi:hypothetical protein